MSPEHPPASPTPSDPRGAEGARTHAARRWPRRLGWAALGLFGLLMALLGSLWVWSGSEGSLAQVLTWTSRLLPAEQQLQVSGVRGNLRRGGQIAQLSWTQPGTRATVHGLRLTWNWQDLLQRQLTLSELSADTLEVRNHGHAPPSEPLLALNLPLTLDAALRLGQLSLPDQGGLSLSGLSAHYHYNGEQHLLQWSSLTLAAGHYRGSIRLQGAAPMALQAQIEGEIATGLQAPAPSQLQARASLQGTLSGASAELRLAAVLEPGQTGTAASAHSAKDAMQAQVQARLRPWAEQVLPEAQAHLSQIDLSLLWPQAPVTALSGQLDVQPGHDASHAWEARLELRNPRAGPWDQHRLPVDQLKAQVRQQTDGAWFLDPVDVRIGSGQLHLQGRWQPDSATPWLAEARLQALSPQRLHSAAPAAAIDGHAALRALPGTGEALGFEFELHPQGGPPATALSASRAVSNPTKALWSALQLRQASARGRWQGQQLQIDRLQIELAQARLVGSLQWELTRQQGQADLNLQAPGLRAQLKGQLSAEQGQGQWLAQLDDAAALTRWLRQWPGLADQALPSQGQGLSEGQWQGGWGAMAAAWQGRSTPPHSQALSVNARIELPRLDWPADPTTGQALTLRQLQLRLGGTLPGAPGSLPVEFSLGGEVSQAGRQASLHLSARAGLDEADDKGSSRWQARVEELSLALQEGRTTSPWQLKLASPVALGLRHQAQADLTELSLAPGEARLSHAGAPELGLRWQNSQWASQQGQTRWSTSGQLQDLTLPWIEQIMTLAQGGTPASLGVSGDLRLNLDWRASTQPRLKAELRLSRQSGDLRLQADDLPSGASLAEAQRNAGVRVAEAVLSLDDGAVEAALQWDSARAGQLQAHFGTRLSQGLNWSPDAPISGSLNAQLPKLGVWSLLAPPGWRMRGTLDARATLQGTLQKPDWQGEIHASDLALRSVVEGVELREGQLRAVLSGHQIDIQEFTLRGAPGAGGDGGSLSAQGHAQWTGQQLQLALKTRANQLRVSSRADRRLALSGELDARLEQGQVKVNGKLKVDQALFILPDETAPSLGVDVKIKRPPDATTKAPPAGPPSAMPAPEVQIGLDLGDDFRVQGRGLSARLRGALTLRMNADSAEPKITGELRTDQGSYKAYGQQLTIETGVLRFSGAYDNPALDVLAIRPNLSVRVGVQINGTVLSPSVRLFSEPEMADADKLAWLVLGRAAASGASESALLQQAALALLGGGRGLSESLAESLGLDNISFSGVSSTDSGVSSAALTLGKRLSKDFYVSYERSLAGTMGTFYIFYDLTRRIALRAQTGEKSAIDLIFTFNYD